MLVTHWCVEIMSARFFDSNTGTWWNCDDDDVNEVSDFPEGLYTRDIHKNNMNKKVMSGSKNIVCYLYQKKQPYSI